MFHLRGKIIPHSSEALIAFYQKEHYPTNTPPKKKTKHPQTPKQCDLHSQNIPQTETENFVTISYNRHFVNISIIES